MNKPIQELQNNAVAALRAGDASLARILFGHFAAAAPGNPQALLGLALACRQLQDDAGANSALNDLLKVEPRNLRALILKGDLYMAASDSRSAVSFYQAALRIAAQQQAAQPADLQQELQRIRQQCDDIAAQYASWLRERLAAGGFDPSRSSARFAQSVDIVLGQKKIYLQEPRYYYFPGLPQNQFYPREQFPWLDVLEQATDAIRVELLEILRDESAFTPYVQGDPNRPRNEEGGMLNNPAWSAFYLWKNGEVVEENARRCPATLAALRDAPLARVPNRSPSILFSLLRPGAHIPPHHGLVNTRLIGHLPLIVPPGCGFRVGNDTREWVRGRAWLFDDTIEHEAWNRGTETRVILLFDVWRPELTLEERDLVVKLFDAIDAHSGRKPEWEI